MLNFPPISGGAPPQIDDLWPDPAIPGVPQWRWDGVKWATVADNSLLQEIEDLKTRVAALEAHVGI